MSDPSEKSIMRNARRRAPYAQIPNAMPRDTRLSIPARGALTMILTYPNDWRFAHDWFFRECCVGRDQGKKLLKELVDFGYCRRTRERNRDGTHGAYEYIFTGEPGEFDNPETRPQAETASDGQPDTGNKHPVASASVKNTEPKTETKILSPLSPPEGGLPDEKKSTTRLPEDFTVPDEWKRWAIDQAPSCEAIVDREAEKFVDHYRSTGRRKADWAATWRNWWREAVGRADNGAWRQQARTAPQSQPQPEPEKTEEEVRADLDRRFAKYNNQEGSSAP